MLTELQFVKGAIAKKDFDPTLTHFLIRNRRVWSFNGVIGLSSPIECDLDLAPQGQQFLKALNACTETISLHMATNGQLTVKAGRFRTFVDCVPPEEHKALPPAGSFVELDGSLLGALRKLEPFIAVDASRPWACGILFRGQSAFATNNITFVEYWLGYNFPIEVNIPTQAVRELIRIGEEPLGLQVCEDRLTFYYSGHRWLMTKLSALEWPNMDRIFDLVASADLEHVDDSFFDAIAQIKPFTDDMGRVIFGDGKLRTSADDAAATVVEFPPAPLSGSYNCDNLLALRGVAQKADFNHYPKPVAFTGDRVRGVVAGLR